MEEKKLFQSFYGISVLIVFILSIYTGSYSYLGFDLFSAIELIIILLTISILSVFLFLIILYFYYAYKTFKVKGLKRKYLLVKQASIIFFFSMIYLLAYSACSNQITLIMFGIAILTLFPILQVRYFRKKLNKKTRTLSLLVITYILYYVILLIFSFCDF